MANAITSVRIICAFGLIFCPTFSAWFYLLYIIGGISDVLDGIIARHFAKVTKFGARLDTIADVVFILTAVIKTIAAVHISLWLVVWIILIAIIKVINILGGFIKYKRFIAEHTVMNKICGVLLFSIPICVGTFPWQAAEILIILTCVAATFAAVLEGYYIQIGKEIS